ncbi:MAG: lactonase family protein [Rhizobiaceae bacterium]
MARRFAFVGCYSGFEPGQLGWVGSNLPGEGISSFHFDEANGELSATGHVTRQASPSWLEPSPCGRFLIATHELSHHTGVEEGVGFLTSYRIGQDGSLSEVNTRPTGGRGNTSTGFDRTGCFLLVTRYWDGGVAALRFNPDTGEIGEITALPGHNGSGPHPTRQSSPHPHGIHGDPKTDFVYAVDLGTDRVHQYKLDLDTGDLVLHSEVPFASGSGPRGIAFHPTLRMAYVNCELDGTVVVCAVDDETGLKPIQSELCYPADFEGENHKDNFGQAQYWGAEGCVTADGRHYYYICRVHQSLAQFDIDGESGKLSFSGRTSLLPGSNARNLTCDPSGRFLLVASQDADSVECFRIDPVSGGLSRTDVQQAPCPADVMVV